MSGKRAKSPPPPLSSFLPQEYANMPVEKVEKLLGEPITRIPLTWVEKLRGKTPDTDPFALDAARQRVYDYEYDLRRLEVDKKLKEASSPPNPNANAGQVDHRAHNSERPPGYPLFPITPDEIKDAAMQVRHIQMGYTEYDDYIKKSNALKIAEERLERLQRQFEIQERDHPGAHKYPPYNTTNQYAFSAPPLTTSQMSSYRRRGGKSKRVKRTKTCKSKRSKRSKTCKNRVHKRRN